MQITLRGVLFPSADQKNQLDMLMRFQSSCMRFSYKRLCEGYTKSEIEKKLSETFPQINSRYRKAGFFRAQTMYLSAFRLMKNGRLKSLKKVVFGGRKNLVLFTKGKLTKKDWERIRNNQVFSRGDKSKAGNLNLRFFKLNGKLYLRVNIGFRNWIYAPAYLPKNQEWLVKGLSAYGVRIIGLLG